MGGMGTKTAKHLFIESEHLSHVYALFDGDERAQISSTELEYNRNLSRITKH